MKFNSHIDNYDLWKELAFNVHSEPKDEVEEQDIPTSSILCIEVEATSWLGHNI